MCIFDDEKNIFTKIGENTENCGVIPRYALVVNVLLLFTIFRVFFDTNNNKFPTVLRILLLLRTIGSSIMDLNSHWWMYYLEFILTTVSNDNKYYHTKKCQAER